MQRKITISTIPTSVREEQFEQYIHPYFITAKRGYECKIALHKAFNDILKRLYMGCQWKDLPIAPDPVYPEKKKSLGKLSTINELDCEHLNLDGSHAIAKKGGESVVYQHPKRAKTSNFNHGLISNMDENRRNRKPVKPGRKRLFNPTVYKRRFSSERSFAWIDKFRALRLRDNRKDLNFLGGHHIAFALINLRHLFAD